MEWILWSEDRFNKFSKNSLDFLCLVYYSLSPSKDNLPNSFAGMPIPWEFVYSYDKFLYFLAQLTCLLQNSGEISNFFILIKWTDVKYDK